MSDRYAVYGAMASGGMAVVHYGRLRGPIGFSRMVAIKRLLPHMAADEDVASMFIDEARLASRIRHPNVVPTLDVVEEGSELYLVMEYVHGETLARLASATIKAGERIPPGIVSAIACGILQGLHSAHEARNEAGLPLRIVHRDVSPQNVIVGTDGITRLMDFGIAKAADRVATTREGQIKGKIRYMSPEQMMGTGVERATDIYAASVVLYELMTSERFYGDADNAAIIGKLMSGVVDPPRDVPAELEALVDVVMHGLAHDASQRFETALEMANAIEAAVPPASPARVGAWVERVAHEALAKRSDQIARIESGVEEPRVSAAAARAEASASAAPISREPKHEARRSWAGPIVLGAIACAGAGFLAWRVARPPPATAAPAIEHATSTPSVSTEAPVASTTVTTAPEDTTTTPTASTERHVPHGLGHHAFDPSIVRALPTDLAHAPTAPVATTATAATPAPTAAASDGDDLYRRRR